MKSKWFLLPVTCLALLLTACSNPAKEPVPVTTTAAGPQDRTVHLENPVVWEGKPLQEVTGMGSFAKMYETIDELNEDSSEVVHGVIDKVEFFYVGRNAFTKMDITIDESLRGSLVAGDKISVYKYGGYIPMSIAEPQFNSLYPDMTTEEFENTIFDSRLNGEPLSQVGQDCVFFLRQFSAEDSEGFPQGLYNIVGEYLGQFVIDESTGEVERFQERFEEPQTLGLDEENPGDASQTFSSYDALKSQVLG